MSDFTLDWLRLNYMETFHYLTNQHKGTPIFENNNRKIAKSKESGAIFNNFDYQHDKLLSGAYNYTVFGAISHSNVRLIKMTLF